MQEREQATQKPSQPHHYPLGYKHDTPPNETAQAMGPVQPMTLYVTIILDHVGSQDLSKAAPTNWSTCMPLITVASPPASRESTILNLHLSESHSSTVAIHNMDSAARLPELESQQYH